MKAIVNPHFIIMRNSQQEMRVRQKALANRKVYIEEPLMNNEKIKDLQAKLRLCKGDLQFNRNNQVLKQKVKFFEEQISELQSIKEVNINGR